MDPLSDDAQRLIQRARAEVEHVPAGEQAHVWSQLAPSLDSGAAAPPISGSNRPLVALGSTLIVGAVLLALLLPTHDASEDTRIEGAAATELASATMDDDAPPSEAVQRKEPEVPGLETPPEPAAVASPTSAEESQQAAPAPRKDASTRGVAATPRQTRTSAEAAEANVDATAKTPDTLLAEMQLLERAQAALGRSDAQGALRILREHRTRFPGGVLTAERMAAQVLALCEADREKQARETADRFLRRFGESPLAQRVRTVKCAGRDPSAKE